MPGHSLWLIPPQNSQFNQIIQSLISETLPQRFAPNYKTHHFIPHVTITSNIDKESTLPSKGHEANDETLITHLQQEWLDNLNLSSSSHPQSTIEINLSTLQADDPFVKKLTIKVSSEGEEASSSSSQKELLSLAAACRSQAVYHGDVEKAESWSRNEYSPHLSLVYSDAPTSYVQRMILSFNQDIREATRHLDVEENNIVARGGSIVLVDTSKPIDQWSIIAERSLPHLLWSSPWNKSALHGLT